MSLNPFKAKPYSRPSALLILGPQHSNVAVRADSELESLWINEQSVHQNLDIIEVPLQLPESFDEAEDLI